MLDEFPVSRGHPIVCDERPKWVDLGPFAKPSGNARKLRTAGGRCRRDAAVADSDRERDEWVGEPTLSCRPALFRFAPKLGHGSGPRSLP